MPADGTDGDKAKSGAPPSSAAARDASAAGSKQPAELARTGTGQTAGVQMEESDGAAPESDRDPPDVVLPAEIAKNLPKGMRQQVETFMAMSGPRPVGPDRLLDRIPPEQTAGALNSILDVSKHEIDRTHESRKTELEFQERRHKRTLWLVGGFTVLAVALIVFCLVTGEKDLARYLITGLLAFVTGALGGYGYGKSRADE